MKRRGRVAGIALLLLLLLPASCTLAADEIVIGVVAPASGPYAAIGKEVTNGAMLAAEVANRRGGLDGRKIKVVIRDESDSSRLISRLNDLVREDPVAVIGPLSASAVRTSNNPLARGQIPTLTLASDQSIRNNPYLFRMVPSNVHFAKTIARWLAGRDLARIAIVHDASAWSRDGAEQLSRVASSSGVDVATRVELQTGLPDQSPLVKSLEASRSDAVVLWTSPADAARVILSARSIGWSPQFAGPSDSLFPSEFRSLTGDVADNVMIAMEDIPEEKWFGEVLRDWLIDYHNEFTILPIAEQRTLVTGLPLAAVTAYDAVNIVLDALRSSKSRDTEAVLGALRDPREREGVLRSYSFGKSRESIAESDLTHARFFNLALLYDISPDSDLDRQIAFYKVQVSAYFVPDEYLDSEEGQKLLDRVLEDVLTNPEEVEFFKPYEAPSQAPGPL